MEAVSYRKAMSNVSEVSIANQALSWLGEDWITSLNDLSRHAEWMKVNFDPLRRAVLESRMWTFATVRAVSDTADLDAWGALFKHDIPENWLGVFRVARDIDNCGNPVWDKTYRVEGTNVLSTYDKVYLWGIQDVVDPAKFSSLFVQTLAARLAADAAIPLTENRELQMDMWALYEAKLDEAATRDGQQGWNDTITQTQLTDVRRLGGS